MVPLKIRATSLILASDNFFVAATFSAMEFPRLLEELWIDL
jgi:hypothetical protein